MAGDRPGNTCRLVGEGDNRDVGVLAHGELPDPETQVVLPALIPAQCRASAMDQQVRR